MSPAEKHNKGHSVFQRLLNYARNNREDFNLILFRYGLERFLYRLGISPYADRFVLKGASLFLVWKGQNYRVTRDADLLGFGAADIEEIIDIFTELCNISTIDIDGVKFMPDSIQAVPIREEHENDGIRVTLECRLHQAKIPLQIDIGFGDVITPGPEIIQFPTLLDAPSPTLRAYPKYTMIAEKLEAIIHLGMANSRMKDFYDLWLLRRLFAFDGKILCEAIEKTLKQRKTPLPDELPMAFTDEFKKDAQKQTQWHAFVQKSSPLDVPDDIDTVIGEIAGFLIPVIESVRDGRDFELFWTEDGEWK